MLFSFKCRFFLNCLFSLDILINQISCGEFSGNWYRRVFTLMNPGGFQVWTAQHTPVQKCDFSVTKSAKCFTFAWVSTFSPCSILYTFLSFAVFLFYVSKFMLIEKNDDKRVHQFVICFIFCTLVFLKSFILRPRRIVSPMMIFFFRCLFGWLIVG